uniref:polycystic kidney disease protein 1-like 3 n=1 Tax=Epinephelus lanceolatus TaxID=310571 RepID=UPI001444A740|nr:polycystic kidney disease protein 1-like 3 [Epinephelus lanceolatus]
MSLASDKLYNGYLRRNMPTIVSKVKVREILNHLPCLTSQDRETIEAKRETYGNYDSMVLLLDCLKRRENWPEQFIKALEACEQPTLAAEIRAEYEALKENNNSSNPSSPPTTVVRAHVHPAPSASHLSGPEGSANSQAAVAPPAEASAPPDPAEASAPPDTDEASVPPEPAEASAPPDTDEASAPPEPAAHASPPVQPQAPQSSAAQVPEAVSPPEPVPEPPQSTQAEVAPPPSTPPPSPAAQHTQPTTPPPPQRETNSHQELVENSESDIQYVSADDVVIPDQVSAGNREVSISSVDAPQPSRPVEQCETHTASPDLLQTTTTSTEVSPPQSPSASQMNSDVTDGSSFLTLTPERPPVQDTSPSGDIKPAAVLQPEETSEPPAAQVVESSPQTEAAATTSPPGAAGTDASLCDDSSVCLCNSGDSEHLEVNGAAPDAVTSAQLPACSTVSSTTVTTASAPPCQENGITLNHNELEENHYESLCPSLGTQAVLETVVHVSEEPSVLNLNGQSSTPQVQINGEAAKEMTSVPPLSNNAADTVPSVNTSCSENHHPSESTPTDLSAEPKTLQDSEDKMACRTLTPNTKYILTAAGVGACALLMAWRFKH